MNKIPKKDCSKKLKLEGFFTWPKLIAFALIMGIYTALMAMFAPDGSSFHDIAVTAEWWVLPAILIIVSCKKPLEAAVKTFVFFLISQPLVYLIQVPFSWMGWGLFSYYKYWFMVTLLTFPGAFIGWFIKKDKWYSGVILAVMTGLLAITGVTYAKGFVTSFPNHLLSTIYCFAMIPILIFGILKDKFAKIITTVITVIAIIVMVFLPTTSELYEAYNNIVIEDNNIVFVGEPHIINKDDANATLIKSSDGYTIKVSGIKGKAYEFSIVDDEKTYNFEYSDDKEQQTIVVKLKS